MKLPEAVHQIVSKVASPVIRRGATVPTDCRVVLQLQAECFRKQDDATMKVASTHATPSTHSPIDGRNIAPPVSVYQTAEAASRVY